ncbi:D-glycerate dehydrogenase [Rhodobacterales bacterium HKCCE2091]|nr:D-glycerate dehydrogenase [Rhodobacterales bacterium HKCCE2091]
MKLLISRRLPDSVMEAAASRFDLTARDADVPMDHAECVAALAEQDAVIPTLGDAFRAEAFAVVPEPRCRLLANFGVGYNHIDVDAARAAGVAVTNTPGAVTDATADIAMTLILMTARRAAEGERLVRTGGWQGWAPTQMLGLHVTGKTVAIIGMGRIGQAIARRCHHGFGCGILYVARSDKSLDHPARRVDLDTALAEADIAVLAVPATPETRHLIDAAALARLRPHAILVNIARGDVIDETALIAALQARSFGGAGLDVYEHEPLVPEALRALDNATLLPHLGTAALEVREAMGRMALSNVIARAEGQPLPNPV